MVVLIPLKFGLSSYSLESEYHQEYQTEYLVQFIDQKFQIKISYNQEFRYQIKTNSSQ